MFQSLEHSGIQSMELDNSGIVLVLVYKYILVLTWYLLPSLKKVAWSPILVFIQKFLTRCVNR